MVSRREMGVLGGRGKISEGIKRIIRYGISYKDMQHKEYSQYFIMTFYTFYKNRSIIDKNIELPCFTSETNTIL